MALTYNFAQDRYVDEDVVKLIQWSEDMDLRTAWTVFYNAGMGEDAFRGEARDHGIEIAWCGNCWNKPHFVKDLVETIDGYGLACQSCIDGGRYRYCTICKGLAGSAYSMAVEGKDEFKWYCRSDFRQVGADCRHCGIRYWLHDSADHDHVRDDAYNVAWGCDCEAAAPEFLVPVNGAMVPNDTPVQIDLPEGKISPDSIRTIERLLSNNHYMVALQLVPSIGDDWTDAKGVTWPKRLASALYKANKTKLDGYTLEDIGNYARRSVVPAGSFDIEFTRHLNQSPTAMGHSGSCWYGGYASSRCALKSNGGYGIRSFGTTIRYENAGGPKPVVCGCSTKCKSAGTRAMKAWKAAGGEREVQVEARVTTGRAWVLPVRVDANGNISPTLDTETPDAVLVFNGYGVLVRDIAARIVSQAYGWDYEATSFDCGTSMSINGGAAYVIGTPEALRHFRGQGGWWPRMIQHNVLLPEYLAEREAAAAQAAQMEIGEMVNA